MKKKSFIFAVIAMVTAMACLTSCSDDDGTWETMKWKGLNEESSSNYYMSQLDF